MDPQEIMEKLRNVWEQAREKVRQLTERFASAVKLVPSVLRVAIEASIIFWNKVVVPLFDKVFQWWDQYCNSLGDPASLIAGANSWRTDVGLPVSQRVGLAEAGQLLVDDTWEGLAADAYKQQLPQQEAALKAIQAQFAEPISSALYKQVGGLIVWWVSITFGVVKFIGATAVATAAATSGAGASAAPPVAAVGCTELLTALAIGTGALSALSLEVKSTFEGASNNFASFPNGSWPSFR